MSTYTKKLAWELESSFVADDEIRSTLERVRDVEARGGDPEVEFGNPQEFAARFSPSPGKKRKYHGIMNAGGLLAAAWFVGIIVAVKFQHVSVPAHFFIPGTVLAILVASTTLSFCLARIRSRSFS